MRVSTPASGTPTNPGRRSPSALVLSVMSGFEQYLQEKILGTNSHGVVLKYSDSMPEYEEVMIRKVNVCCKLYDMLHNGVMTVSCWQKCIS